MRSRECQTRASLLLITPGPYSRGWGHVVHSKVSACIFHIGPAPASNFCWLPIMQAGGGYRAATLALGWVRGLHILGILNQVSPWPEHWARVAYCWVF